MNRFTHPLKLACVFFLRDWRAKEIQLLALALLMAVMAMSSVGFLVDRVEQAMSRDATQLLGADVVVQSHLPITPEWVEHAHELGLETAQTLEFPTIVFDETSEKTILTSLKAISSLYPLRGGLSLRDPHTAGRVEVIQGKPKAGEVWVDEVLLTKLDAQLGASVAIGTRNFTVSRVIDTELDRGTFSALIAPRIMLSDSDVESTGLISSGSRVRYRLMVAGSENALTTFKAWLEPQLVAGQRIQTIDSDETDINNTLEKAQHFFVLLSALTSLISAVAIALASRQYTQRHINSIGIMKCLGLKQSLLMKIMGYEFLILTVSATTLGLLMGYVIQELLVWMLSGLISTDLPVPGYKPALYGFLTALLLLLSFALPPLLALRDVLPKQVLMQTVSIKRVSWISYLVGGSGFGLLLFLYTHDVVLSLITLGGFLGFLAIFVGLSLGILKVLTWIPVSVFKHVLIWRFALNGLRRRTSSSVIQICALAIGLMAILLLFLTRNDLLNAWQDALPADAPNRFVINITNEQKEAVQTLFSEAGHGSIQLYPMVRGRLLAVNGQELNADDFRETRAKNLLEREFNLSYLEALPEHNSIVQGEWMANDVVGNQVSMESGIAELFNINVGDQLTWRVAGQDFTTQVTSIRDLRWDSMQVNFFAIMNPVALETMPQTWITSVHLTPNDRQFETQLIKQFTNLTIFNTDDILKKIQSILAQVSQVIQLLFMFTLLSGGLVLYIALTSNKNERMAEVSLLRSLGATQRQLYRIQYLELALIGCLAGGLAAFGASTIAWALAHFVFKFAFTFQLWVFASGVMAGLFSALLSGYWRLREVLHQSPLHVLRLNSL